MNVLSIRRVIPEVRWYATFLVDGLKWELHLSEGAALFPENQEFIPEFLGIPVGFIRTLIHDLRRCCLPKSIYFN